jgi:ubiquinone/menaquinone biosynthesis C-methylase UbiE
LFEIERIARGYAFDRPPVHEAILQTVNPRRVRRALDVGCGAGKSSKALRPFADMVIGLEPSRNMLRFNNSPMTVVARAEELPFAAGTFQLVTAAGSLNYVDNRLFLPEAARVLTPGGTLLIYDCSSGSRAYGDDRLASWFSELDPPVDPGVELDVKTLPFAEHGMSLESYQEFPVMVRMSMDAYHRYILTETAVDLSRAALEALTEIFDGSSLDVVFDTYAARVRRDP